MNKKDKKKAIEANNQRNRKDLYEDKDNFVSNQCMPKARNRGAGKGDRTSAAWVTTEKYQRAMEANEAYKRGEITVEEWREIVHGKRGQGD